MGQICFQNQDIITSLRHFLSFPHVYRNLANIVNNTETITVQYLTKHSLGEDVCTHTE